MAILALLLVLIQYPLWLGRGGWLQVWEMRLTLQQMQEQNAQLRQRNASLEAEVADLRAGTQALEERARFELGMVGEGEVFVQILEAPITRSTGTGADRP